MSDPIIHVQLFDDIRYKIDKYVIGFRLVKQLPLIYSLYIEVSVNRNLNYRYIKKFKLCPSLSYVI